ncbi:hypothetical protein AB4156_15535 [Cupriavidus sp. 2MCAB6]|uniref:hypothetical protein n=1 Tax=Cupriavidus sp. 2MCAB6 TaxID=3232981 RepID=UPI003F93F2E6
MDLLHEVRQVSRQLQVAARRCTRGITYADALRDLIDDRMQGADRRARIICYASAADLGVHVELAAEHARQAMTGGSGFRCACCSGPPTDVCSRGGNGGRAPGPGLTESQKRQAKTFTGGRLIDYTGTGDTAT